MIEPTNEQETIVLFSSLCDELNVEILSISQMCYPDSVIRWRDGNKIKVEFEHLASNFIKHRHDPKGCDLIVCWKNDLPNGKTSVPIFSIHEYLKDKQQINILKSKRMQLKMVFSAKVFLFLYAFSRLMWLVYNGNIDATNQASALFIGELFFILFVALVFVDRIGDKNEQGDS